MVQALLTPRPTADVISIVTDPIDRELVARALSGEEAAVREVLELVTPAVQQRVARTLAHRVGAARGRNVRQELEDMVQDVLLRLFSEDGRVLREWDPARGMNLKQFVGLIAERHIASVLRSSRRSPWTEDPTLSEDLQHEPDSAATPETLVASREAGRLIFERVRERLSPLGLQLFYALLVEERSIESITAETGMQRGAIYTWKNRLHKLVHQIAAELEKERSGPHEPSVRSIGGRG